jgi:2,4-diketo-3-deoxy-L-fuconate hydrolase
LARLAAINAAELPRVPAGVRLGPPVAGSSKFVAIGLNYADHAAEAGMQIPTEPIIFLKALTSMCGPNDPVEKPRGSTKLDWEVELGFVIGTKAKYVSEADAMNYVAGYCVGNDVSERNFQLERLGNWTKGKSHDTFGPLGPWLVTRDEIPDPHKLAMWLDVNGERQQSGSTATMIFKVPKLISYVSEFMTLLPGDVVVTGTPPGVGSGKKPPRFLKVGDIVTLGIDGLGAQRQQIVAA